MPSDALPQWCVFAWIDEFGKHTGKMVAPKRGDLANHRLREPLTHAATVQQKLIEAPIGLLRFGPRIRDSV